ncbi:MAG: hypothetical protein ABJB61_03125 [bacterium]
MKHDPVATAPGSDFVYADASHFFDDTGLKPRRYATKVGCVTVPSLKGR